MQCFSFFVCASFEVETQRGIKRQMFRDEPSVSEMFTFCSLVVCVIRRIIEVTHLEVRVREWRVSLMLFCADYFTFFNAFPQCVSVGFIMLQERSRSFPRSIIQGSVSHRQSLKFHRKQFGGWVICKARWVHTVVPYLCLRLWLHAFHVNSLLSRRVSFWLEGTLSRATQSQNHKSFYLKKCFDTRQL